MSNRLPGFDDPAPPTPRLAYARLTVSLDPAGAVERAEVELKAVGGGELFYRAMRPVRGYRGPDDPLRELLACADRLTRDA